jgi:hypothetical protein
MKALVKTLFIGGPWDGRRERVDTELSTIIVRLPPPMLAPGVSGYGDEMTYTLEHVAYRREILINDDGVGVVIYFHGVDPIRALLDKYPAQDTYPAAHI